MNIMELLTVCHTVVYGNGIWLAGGEGSNSLLRSTDGIYWTAAGHPLGSGVIRGLACSQIFGNGDVTWIAVGNSSDNVSTISLSTDNGLTWSPVSEDPLTGGQANSVTFEQVLKDIRFIVLGVVNGVQQIVFSGIYQDPEAIEDPEGFWYGVLTWTAYDTSDISGVFTNTVTGYDDQYSPMTIATRKNQTPSMAVLTTEWASIQTANDPFPGGCTALGFFQGVQINGEDFGTLWVAGGANKLARSIDGITWTTMYTGTNFTPTGITNVGGKNWYVVSGTSILKSENGVSWTEVEHDLSGTLTNIFYASDLLFVTGNVGALAISTHGELWFVIGMNNAMDPFFRGAATSVKYLNGKWFACGYGVSSLATSVDALTWTGLNPLGVGGTIRDIAVGPGSNGASTFIAVGNNADYSSCIVYSTDGVTWSIQNTIQGYANKIINVNNTWYIACVSPSSQTKLLTSENGVTWTETIFESYPFFHITNGLNETGDPLIILGSPVSPSMLLSLDGGDWNPIIDDPYIAGSLTALYYTTAPYNGSTQNLWVAGGGGNTLTVSTNGIEWTNVYTDETFTPLSILYNGTWTVVGTGTSYTMLTSPDLITWTPIYQDFFTPETGVNGFAHANSISVAVGSIRGGSIAVKIDGEWSMFGVPPITTEPGVPEAPSNVTVIPSNTTAMVSWTVPNSQVTGYRIYTFPDNKRVNTADSSATSLNVTGLKNGIPYTFSVVATNELGSSYTARCTPSTLPGVPKVTAVGGNAQVTLTWVSAPAPGVSTTGFTITCNNEVTIPENPTSPLVVTGLTNGLSYTFSIRAVNIIGTSAAGVSKAIIPTTIPDVPTSFAVLPGSKSFQVTWDAPFNGGLPITEYAITYIGGGRTVVGKGKATAPFTFMVTKLLSGISYDVTIQAKNKLGLSAVTETVTVVTL